MLISIVLGVLLLDAILRCILFKEIGIKWWKGLIPLYNRYELGKAVEDKSLGIIFGTVTPIFYLYYSFCVAVELFIIKTFSVNVSESLDKMEVLVPKSVATLSVYSKAWLLIFAVCMIALWIGLTFKFSKKYTKRWHTLLWLIPPVGYIVSIVQLKRKKGK